MLCLKAVCVPHPARRNGTVQPRAQNTEMENNESFLCLFKNHIRTQLSSSSIYSSSIANWTKHCKALQGEWFPMVRESQSCEI